eukprot:3613536-Rhodomonas_salina.1
MRVLLRTTNLVDLLTDFASLSGIPRASSCFSHGQAGPFPETAAYPKVFKGHFSTPKLFLGTFFAGIPSTFTPADKDLRVPGYPGTGTRVPRVGIPRSFPEAVIQAVQMDQEWISGD